MIGVGMVSDCGALAVQAYKIVGESVLVRTMVQAIAVPLGKAFAGALKWKRKLGLGSRSHGEGLKLVDGGEQKLVGGQGLGQSRIVPKAAVRAGILDNASLVPATGHRLLLDGMMAVLLEIYRLYLNYFFILYSLWKLLSFK